jgi:L-ascorbate metabolism protein UlaG (beta-lactamase superfamily)
MAYFGGMTLTWLGHATLHIQTAGGTSILVDPWIEGNPSSPKGYKLPEKIDVLLLTHGHDDHFHDAVKVALQTKAKVVGIYELTSFMQGKGVENIAPMNYGGNLQIGNAQEKDLRISMVEARHSSSIVDGGKAIYAGNPCGYVLSSEGSPTIYLAGDTSLFGDMRLYKELYAPEIGVLPIGDNFTMGPKHAALAATYLGVKTVVPVHYGTFPALTGTPSELKEHLRGAGAAGAAVEVATLTPGEPMR